MLPPDESYEDCINTNQNKCIEPIAVSGVGIFYSVKQDIVRSLTKD